MPRARMLLIFCMGLPISNGCSWPPRQTNVLCPGTECQQQRRAEHFDPYPESGFAPEVVGGRPRGYMDPISEPLRAVPWQDR